MPELKAKGILKQGLEYMERTILANPSSIQEIIDEANRLKEALAELEQIEPKSCEWVQRQDPIGDTFYDTKCGQSQYFGNGGIKENHYVFCPYCGGKIHPQI